MGVESSTPGNASAVNKAPDEATITFNADVDIDTAAAELRRIGETDTAFKDYLNSDTPTEKLRRVSAEYRTSVFDLPELEPGLYAIDWSVDEAGGHSNSGFIIFEVTGESGRIGVLAYGTGGALILLSGLSLYLLKRRNGTKQ
jgi:methionine-rich copper-binding protein CopC